MNGDIHLTLEERVLDFPHEDALRTDGAERGGG